MKPQDLSRSALSPKTLKTGPLAALLVALALALAPAGPALAQGHGGHGGVPESGFPSAVYSATGTVK